MVRKHTKPLTHGSTACSLENTLTKSPNEELVFMWHENNAQPAENEIYEVLLDDRMR